MQLREAALLLHDPGTSPLDVEELDSFVAHDPFNDQYVSGYLCKRSDYRYGALVIYEVDNQKTEPQVIWCTPKLHYPFKKRDDGERIFDFPMFQEVYCYEKYDGTNILQYSYKDAGGKRFCTYKTRLTPFVMDGKYGSFCQMLKEMLEAYPFVHENEFVMSGKFTLSYEMYGARNPHIIEYDIPLDLKLLFGVWQEDHSVCVPQTFSHKMPTVSTYPTHQFNNGYELKKVYEEIQEETESHNVTREDGIIAGKEGYVFYVFTSERKWEMFKCKSGDVELIHWSGEEGIPTCFITPTVINAFESTEDVTVEYVIELLKEEYPESLVYKSYNRIQKILDKILEKIRWRDHVHNTYKTLDVSFEKNTKGEVMRELSKHFEKRQMQSVFASLKELNLVQ